MGGKYALENEYTTIKSIFTGQYIVAAAAVDGIRIAAPKPVCVERTGR
jgi:hypothetical protein